MFKINPYDFKISGSQTKKILGQKALGETGLSYLKEWVKEQLYSRERSFYSKYTDKGNSVEQSSIDYVSDFFGWGVVRKNEERFSNKWIEGTPDLILSTTVEDVKNSWDCFTFPLFDKEPPKDDYEYQLQSYMDITGKSKAGLIYILMDAPEHLIDSEAWNEAKSRGEMEVSLDLHDEVRQRMTYSNLPDDLRIKRFEINRDETIIKKIHDRVDECRDLIPGLVADLKGISIIYDIDHIGKHILNCNSLPQLEKLWKDHEMLHDHPKFVATIKNRKEEIKSFSK